MARERALDDAACRALVDHIASNFAARHELALHWLYHEALCDDVEASTADATMAPTTAAAAAHEDDDDDEQRTMAVSDRLLDVPQSVTGASMMLHHVSVLA